MIQKSQSVLRGEQVVLGQKKAFGKPQTERKGRGEVAYEPDLLEELMKLRKYLAKKEDVPAYMILSDRTLHELAVYLHKANLASVQRPALFEVAKRGNINGQFSRRRQNAFPRLNFNRATVNRYGT